MPLPLLPPAFHLVALDRELQAFRRAVEAAPRGADDGTVYWTDRGDRLEVAFVLEPEGPADATLPALYVLAVAAGDALGALLPPILPVAFAWPCDLLLDGARIGRLRCAMAPASGTDATPPWLVLGLSLEVASLGHDPGLQPDRTSLVDVGADGITTVRLVESVTRHFLAWVSRWQEEGTAPVIRAWNNRCFRRGEEAELVLGGERVSGRVGGLDPAGAFVVGDRRVALGPLLPELG